MRISRKLLVSAAALALGAGATLAGTAAPADARTRFFLGIALPPLIIPPPPIFRGPPRYYYRQPPAYYGPPPGYYAPPPAYYAPPCTPRYDWRWTDYGWQRAYVGCW